MARPAGLAAAPTRISLARLNHILIPATKEGRDAVRRRPVVRVILPVLSLVLVFSEEGRFLLLVSALVGAMGLEVQATQLYLLWCVLAGLLGGSLLLRRWFSLGAARIEVQAARRVAIGEELRFDVSVVSGASRGFDAVRVRGPMLPWDGRYTLPPPPDAPLAPGGRIEQRVGVRFSERGEHHLEPFFAAALVPLGLVLGRALEGPSYKVVVVPRVAVVQRLTTPPTTRHQPGGVALASKTGESMELLGLRPYRPGDPVRDLHARASARLGAPHVREYQQEYFSRFGVVLDTDLAGASPAQFEAAISLAAGVVAHLGRGEALVDLLVVGDEAHSLTLGRSLGRLEQALDLLACAAPRPLDPARLQERLRPFLDRLSCVVLIWLSFDGPRAAVTQALGRRVACRTLVVSDEAAGGPAVTSLSPAAIERGEPLIL
jgi:uncharacterized protein (DUF58 family)